MMPFIVFIFVLLLGYGLWFELGKQQACSELEEALDNLADCAIKYCEGRRLNRMESFQRADWSRYVAAAEVVEELQRESK
jgi:hypothetical protein